MRMLAIAAFLSYLSCADALAQTAFSGNEMFKHCQNAAGQSTSLGAMDGICAGIIAGVGFNGRILTPQFRFCIPDGVSPQQAVRVVVNYMEARRNSCINSYKSLRLRRSARLGLALDRKDALASAM